MVSGGSSSSKDHRAASFLVCFFALPSHCLFVLFCLIVWLLVFICLSIMVALSNPPVGASTSGFYGDISDIHKATLFHTWEGENDPFCNSDTLWYDGEVVGMGRVLVWYGK